MNWVYNTKQRAVAPDDVADILAWLARNTREVRDLADPALCRQLLSAATSRLDGTRAAPTSVAGTVLSCSTPSTTPSS